MNKNQDTLTSGNAVFVFGSNRAGRHGKGAAAFARRFYGATSGCGEGAQGQAYGIPTKDENLAPLSLEAIRQGVARFYQYASAHPDTVFQVTRIGCGLAGFDDDQIRPLFHTRNLPDNCVFPGLWLRRAQPNLMRVVVAGGRAFDDGPRLNADLDRLREKHSDKAMSIVSGLAKGADMLGAQWARSAGVPVVGFPAQWSRYGRAAGYVRNRLMAWYGTHLVAYWDGQSKGTGHMIATAEEDGLAQWVRRY